MATHNEFLDLSKYTLKKKIGNGTFGQVFTVNEKETNNIYAAKISFKEIDSTKKESLRNFTREVNLISQIKHPSILQFIGFSPFDFENSSKPVIITEYCPYGTLKDAIDSKLDEKGWNDTKALINLYGIASALSFLHSNEILHRDLKPQNILLDENLYPKIADFGLSKINSNSNGIDTLSGQSTSDIKGTLIYMSPEVITDSLYTPACDVYAFAIIVYQLITKLEPYKNNKNHFQLMNQVSGGFRPKFTTDVPEIFKKMIEKCWEQSPDLRPSFDDIVSDLKSNDSFITEKVDREEFKRYVNHLDNSVKNYNGEKRIFYSSYYKKNENLENNDEVANVLNQISDPDEPIDSFKDDSNQNIESNKEKIQEVESSKEKVQEVESNKEKVQEVESSKEKIQEVESSKEKVQEVESNKEKVQEVESNKEKVQEVESRKEKVQENESNEEKVQENEPNEEKNQEVEPNKEKIQEDESSNGKVQNLEIDKSDPSSQDKDTVKDNFQKNISNSSKVNRTALSRMNSNYQLKLCRTPSSSKIKFYKSDRINTISYKNNDQDLYPILELAKLDEDCQQLVKEAENDPYRQYEVGRSLIEGTNGFPHRPDIGMKYISKSKDYQCIKAIVYYCNLLYEGIVIPKDVSEAKKILKKYIKGKNSDAQLLYAKILMDENDYSNAIKNLTKASKEANSEAMFELAKIFIFGLGGNKDFSKANEYFEMAKNNGNEKSQMFLDTYNQIKEQNGFISFPGEVQQIIITDLIEEDEINLNRIWINSDSIYSMGYLDSPNLIEFLASFEEVGAYAIYPSFTFPRVFNILSKIKNNSLNELKVQIIIDSPITVEHLIAHNSIIDYIVFNNSVKQISPNSFNGCKMLRAVEFLSDSINSIGNYAFYGCSSLEQIEIPSSVKAIGKSAFSNCSSIINLDLPPSIPSINECLFFECFSLTEVKIPPSVTEIKEAAFFGCCSLVTIEIPESVMSIGDDCFNGCSKLTVISIPSNCKSIGKSAFAGCLSLSKIEICSSIDNFAEGLFAGCKSLKDISIPKNASSIEEAVFYGCSNLKKIEIPNSVKSINEAAFCGCSSLECINVPNSLEFIGVSAFQDCNNLNELVLPSSLKVIGSFAFNGCKKFKKISVPSSLIKIGVGAFCRCDSLEEVTVPPSLTDKGDCLGLDPKTKMNII